VAFAGVIAESNAAPDTAKPARAPVVVELFTSEGCSSCPAADLLLAKLVSTQPVGGAEVIALSEHVDYWNRLGWTDPFSSKQFSERQGRYAKAWRQARIYTPQMVVDGGAEFVGSDGERARREIARAAGEPKAAVALEAAAAGGGLRVAVRPLPPAQRPGSDSAEVLLAVVEDGLRSEVRRGENAGRSLAHVAVVRRLEVLGPLASGEPFDRRLDVVLDPSWRRERLRAVAFVQEVGSRRILGAAQIPL
jgi:hypothetical protein